MTDANHPKYAAAQIRAIPFYRPAVPLNARWWRFTWDVEHELGQGQLAAFEFPDPSAKDADELTCMVGLVEADQRRLRVEVLSRSQHLEGQEIGYLSILFQELERVLGPLRINGYADHSILKASARRRAGK